MEASVDQDEMVLITLLVPEFVVARTAYRQFLAARALITHLNEADTGAIDSSPGPKGGARRKYSMAYGYWVEMGGFVISTSDISKEHEFVAITAQGAIHLAKLGHVFEISDEQIADRSKCDWLGKSLFCIQVTWTFIQCVARASFGHPLTLLETHTLVHVVFAICLHLLWWHKPKDVDEQVVIDASEFMGVVSLLFMGSVLIDSDLFPEIESLFIYDDALEARSRSTGHEHRHTIVPNTTQANDSTISEHGTLKNEVDTLTITGAEHLSCGIGPYIKTVILGKKDIRRWCLCAHALVRLEAPLQTSFENTATYKLSRNCDGSISTESTSERIIGQYWLMNHPFAIWFLFGESGQKNLIVVLFLPIIYGGMHLSAINTATFPSSIEAILWYISAGGVAAVPWIYLVLIMVMMAMDDVNQSLIVAILDTLHVTINNIAWLGAIISQLFRRYMFVESFISLRNVSLGVYAEIPWLQAIPHI